ncbi:hypothetical protein IQ225_19190, partial [Synechocystis salina LEGE 06155]|nr:hypothetical protein [Synechocystis salina LEGE 06155]
MTSLEHSILLANLGTSDLAIKHSKYGYFIPLSFNSEPNLIRPTAGSDEYQAWQERDSLLQEIYGELEIHQERPVFRLVTEKLSEKLKQTEDFTKWYPRIIPVRLLGFISQALENRKFKNIHTIYLFTTNQGSPGHISDTVYVFDIIEIWLERWLQDKNYKHINIRKIEVDFSPINLDRLFDFYYKKIDGLISDDQKEITAL